jgi:Oxidoreductase molybdopterin binding domain
MQSQKVSGKLFVVIVLSLCLSAGHLPQPAGAAQQEVALVVRDVDGGETKLSFSEIAKLPRTMVRARDEKGKESLWEGPALQDVLKSAGIRLGEAIRGKALANYLLVEAADGYRVVFALPEMDPAFTDHKFLLADRRDGEPLNDYEGKFRIVVPGEKRHARWVRRVVAMSIRHAE